MASRLARLCLISWCACATLAASAVQAVEERFTADLAPEVQAAMGLQRLSDNERASLNAQIAREVKLARSGDAIAFAGTFTTRRPRTEWTAAGLDKLSEAERSLLDERVAAALADRPVTIPGRNTASTSVAVEDRPRGEWHGELSLMYGQGSGGREFYGGSVTTIYEDHKAGFAAAVTLSEFHGDGFGYGYGCGPGWGYRNDLSSRHRWRR